MLKLNIYQANLVGSVVICDVKRLIVQNRNSVWRGNTLVSIGTNMLHLSCFSPRCEVVDRGIGAQGILVEELSTFRIGRGLQVNKHQVNNTSRVLHSSEADQIKKSISMSTREPRGFKSSHFEAIANRLVNVQRDNSISLGATSDIQFTNTKQTLVKHRQECIADRLT